jgi:predicted metal-dependent hydrolase
MAKTYPAAEVNEWLLEQRDQLQEHQAKLEAQIRQATDETEKRQLYDAFLITNGQLGAMVQTWTYFGKMWG